MSKLILCPNTEVSPDITASDNCTCNELIWESGHLIDPARYNLTNLEFVCETLPTGSTSDYMISDTGCSIISKKLKNFFDRLKIDNIQYFDASIISRAGEKPEPEFFAANILGLFDVIDRPTSEMDTDLDDDGEPTIVYGIDKLALIDPLPNHGSIYRVFSFSRLILVDETFRESLEQTSITGLRLVQPEKWDGIYGEI